MNLKKILKKIFGREEIPPYPREYALVDFTNQAKREGIRNDQNKIIKHYFVDKYGFRKLNKYRYSKAMIYSLIEVKKIPIIDLTMIEETLPVFSKVFPSRISYKE